MGQGVRQADRESVWAAKLRAGLGLSERPVQKGATANAFPVFVPTRRPAARTRRQLPTPNSQRPTTPNRQPPTPNVNSQLPPGTTRTLNGVALGMQLDMETTDWNPKKPYDLRERLFEFGCLVIRLVQYLHTRGPMAIKRSEQTLKAGTSAPAN